MKYFRKDGALFAYDPFLGISLRFCPEGCTYAWKTENPGRAIAEAADAVPEEDARKETCGLIADAFLKDLYDRFFSGEISLPDEDDEELPDEEDFDEELPDDVPDDDDPDDEDDELLLLCFVSDELDDDEVFFSLALFLSYFDCEEPPDDLSFGFSIVIPSASYPNTVCTSSFVLSRSTSHTSPIDESCPY